jgi:hypothetical protein
LPRPAMIVGRKREVPVGEMSGNGFCGKGENGRTLNDDVDEGTIKGK